MHPIIQRSTQAVLKRLPRRFNGLLVRLARDQVPDSVREQCGLLDGAWSLRNAAANGLAPGAIVDVGACRGKWSLAARKIFPRAQVLMIEANPECKIYLAEAVRALPGAACELVLLGPRAAAAVPFYQMHEGSSVLPELSDVPRRCVALEMRTLDQVVEAHALPGPLLLKLDVQGFELEVLKGGGGTLARSAAVFMEVSFIPYNQDAPLFAAVVAQMAAQGFVLYDLCSTRRRAADGALFQSDVLFVREDSPLRSPKPFFR